MLSLRFRWWKPQTEEMTAASRTLLESSAKINYKIGGIMPVGVGATRGSRAARRRLCAEVSQARKDWHGAERSGEELITQAAQPGTLPPTRRGLTKG